MQESMQMSKKIFYLIVGLCATIIFMNSLETFLKVKDISLFNRWIETFNDKAFLATLTEDLAYMMYFNFALSSYLIKIVIAIGISINTYLVFTKMRVTKLYVWVWSVLLIGSMGIIIISETFFSIFFIITMACYIGLIGNIFYLWRKLSKKK
ncbi:MAG: hypothetical protein ACRDCW_07015 [Sarcina sp.]